jgi:hypothetical protein
MMDVSEACKSRKLQHFRPALASTVALCLCAWTSAASSEPAPGVNRARYQGLESFSHEFGSKFTSGYFVSETGKCLVTLMLAEKSDPEMPSRQTPARVRLTLNPGQMASLDSEEAQSVNFTCANGATALLVDRGKREALIASQKGTPPSETSAALDWEAQRQW